MKTLLIRPLEPFLFRTAKPFNPGDTLAESIFPPNPATIYGALRSAVISQKSSVADFLAGKHRNELQEEIGMKDKLGKMEIISSNLLADNLDATVTEYIQLPRDLVADHRNSNLELSCLQIDESIGTYGLQIPVTASPDLHYPENSWFAGLPEYLKGELGNLTFLPARQLLTEEEKIGIACDNDRGTTREHALFTQCRLRLQDGYSLGVQVKNLTQLDAKGILTIGQDGRLFFYQTLPSGNAEASSKKNLVEKDVAKKIEEGGRMGKLLFTTPAVFKNGWLPEKASINGGEITWEPDQNGSGLQVRLLSCCNAPPVPIGGWDMAKKQPKALRAGVGAGTVWFFKLEKGQAQDFIQLVHNHNLGDFTDLNQQGFGHTLVGAVPTQQISS